MPARRDRARRYRVIPKETSEVIETAGAVNPMTRGEAAQEAECFMGGTTQMLEKTKPKTDRARFHRVIERLQAEGFYYANACCQSCGFGEANAEGAENIVNINEQSIGRAFYGDSDRIPVKRLPAMMVMSLYVAYDGNAQRIVEVFKEEGFTVEWDGDLAHTICVRPELWPDRPTMDRLKKGVVA
jgi:hypothetical protein